MFKEDTLFLLIRNWWKYKPEDELYYKLQENPVWPFRQIADGYYYVVVQSDRYFHYAKMIVPLSKFYEMNCYKNYI